MKLTVLCGSGAHDNNAFTLECPRAFRVRLEPIAGERGRFFAVSETRFQCAPPCSRQFTRSLKQQEKTGDGCPYCGEFAGRVRYLVDVIDGDCCCEAFTTRRGVEPCKHIHAALYLFGKLEAAEAAGKNI